MTGSATSEDVGTVRPQTVELALPPEGFPLELGGNLSALTVAFETYGQISPAKDNVVYICHALTGDAHVAGRHSADDPKPGWWDEMVGPGKGIDTDYYHVICANILGSCNGTTGPASIDPATGRPYGASFPEITITDMVGVQKLLLDHLGITHLAAVIGGSLGGMQVLEWAIRYPEVPARCICVASGHTLSTQALAFDVVARDAIRSDPAWRNGDYYEHGNGPEWGLAHARKIGHITYLSPEIMQSKFGRQKGAPASHTGSGHRFEVENYLDYQGKKLVDRFDANSYLRITDAMDRYDLEEEFGSLDKAFESVSAKFLIVALSSDWLFPPEQSRRLANALLRAGREVSCCTLRAPYGHDAFLIDVEYLADAIRAFLPWVNARRSLINAAVTSSPREAERSEAPLHGDVGRICNPAEKVASMTRESPDRRLPIFKAMLNSLAAGLQIRPTEKPSPHSSCSSSDPGWNQRRRCPAAPQRQDAPPSDRVEEFELIAEMLPEHAKILDLGCGSGKLLSYLEQKGAARGLGVDIELDNVITVIDRGHDVYQDDIDTGLSMIPDGAYDCAILSQTLQVVKRPRFVLREMLRVAKEGIVSFPNFGKWSHRLRIAFLGRMPGIGADMSAWFDTPDIHPFTRRDFIELCREDGIRILDTVCIADTPFNRLLLSAGICNVGADRVIARIAPADGAPTAVRCRGTAVLSRKRARRVPGTAREDARPPLCCTDPGDGAGGRASSRADAGMASGTRGEEKHVT